MPVTPRGAAPPRQLLSPGKARLQRPPHWALPAVPPKALAEWRLLTQFQGPLLMEDWVGGQQPKWPGGHSEVQPKDTAVRRPHPRMFQSSCSGLTWNFGLCLEDGRASRSGMPRALGQPLRLMTGVQRHAVLCPDSPQSCPFFDCPVSGLDGVTDSAKKGEGQPLASA